MTSDSTRRIAVAFARQVALSPDSLWCAACVEVLTVTGAGITLMGGAESGPICVSDASVAALEEVQFDLGEGPCRDAFRTGRPVHVAHFDRAASGRWPAFAELAVTSSIGAVFAYPLPVDDVCVGVLTVYQADEGDLSTTQAEDCLAVAAVLAETILSLQADEPDETLAAGLDAAITYRAEIYQASGVVAVQLSISPSEAVARIRGHAFAAGQPVATIAADILAHRLRLPDDRQLPASEV